MNQQHDPPLRPVDLGRDRTSARRRRRGASDLLPILRSLFNTPGPSENCVIAEARTEDAPSISSKAKRGISNEQGQDRNETKRVWVRWAEVRLASGVVVRRDMSEGVSEKKSRVGAGEREGKKQEEEGGERRTPGGGTERVLLLDLPGPSPRCCRRPHRRRTPHLNIHVETPRRDPRRGTKRRAGLPVHGDALESGLGDSTGGMEGGSVDRGSARNEGRKLSMG